MSVLLGNKHICWMNADSKHVNVCNRRVYDNNVFVYVMGGREFLWTERLSLQHIIPHTSTATNVGC